MMQTAHFFATGIDGVEIDPRLSAIGRRFFGLRDSPRLCVHHEDARTFLIRNRTRYDVIYVDLYAGGPYVPFHVATRELYALVRRALSLGGIVAVNVPFYAMGTRLGERMVATIAAELPVVLTHRGMAFGMLDAPDPRALRSKLTSGSLPPALRRIGAAASGDLERFERDPGEPVFTDDLAAIERMTFEVLSLRDDEGRRAIDPNPRSSGW